MAITYRQPGVPGIQTWAPGVALTFPPSDMARIENAISDLLARLHDEERDRPWPGPYIDRGALEGYEQLVKTQGATRVVLLRILDDELWRAQSRLARLRNEVRNIPF